MSDAVKVTLPSGTVATCSPEQAERYQAAEKPVKKAPAKKAASSQSSE